MKIFAILAITLSALLSSPSGRKAGVEIEAAEVAANGVDSYFTISEISDAAFERMLGKSYPSEECDVKREDLRYLQLIHYNFKGNIQVGELVCSKTVASELSDIFKELYYQKYQIEKMLLIDEYGADDEKSMTDNNSSCFCYRKIAGSTRLSKHALGIAIDINPLYNPCVKGTFIQPACATQYVDRSAKFAHKLTSDDPAVKLFKEKGWNWGGDWKSVKDYQHFDKIIQ